MRKIILVLFVFTCLGLHAETRTEKREANPFDVISLRVAANLFYSQGEENSIEITGKDETLDKIIVEVTGNKLIIRFSFEDRFINDFDPGDIKIKVISTEISAINVQGTGNVFVENEVQAYSLDLNIAGSGDIKIGKLSCNRLDVSISGSGNVVVSGNKAVNEIEVDIAGSGDVIAHQLESESAFIRIAGSGDCDLNITKFLEIRILGSGDVYYKGDPQVKSKISGSGKVKQKI